MDTRQHILQIARRDVQAKGYNALSFRELAKQVGVKSASIHYHFPTKGDLGAELARQYTEQGVIYLDALLDECTSEQTCFDRYAAIFRGALENQNRMCLCGIMAAEVEDLPSEVREQVQAFNKANLGWIGRALHKWQPGLDPETAQRRALAIFSAMEGAQLIARGSQDIGVFDRALQAYRDVGLI